MNATWYLLASRWRRGLGEQVLLAVVVALAGIMVLATLAGARRTETAYDRFVEAARLTDAFLVTGGGAGVVMTDEQIRAVRALPQVAASTRLREMAMEPAAESLFQPTVAPLDGGWGRDLAVSRFVEGRAPTAADEVSLTEQRAELLGLSIGDTLTMSSYTPEQTELAKTGDESVFGDPQGPRMDLTLVGIERTPQSIATDRDIAGITILTAAFVDRYGDQIGSSGDLLALDLRDDEASLQGFSDAVRAIPGLAALQFEVGVGSSAPAETLAFVAGALRVLATIAALAGTATLALVMLRGAGAQVPEDAILGGLGLDRRQRRRLLVLGVVPGTLAGVVVAAAGAIVASALFPFGLGGRAEPDPGVRADARGTPRDHGRPCHLAPRGRGPRRTSALVASDGIDRCDDRCRHVGRRRCLTSSRAPSRPCPPCRRPPSRVMGRVGLRMGRTWCAATTIDRQCAPFPVTVRAARLMP